LFITTKTPQPDLSKETILANGPRYLEELDIPYIDLLLIHWPNREYPIKESLEAMQELKEKDIIRAFGVSNFTIHHMQDCLDAGFEIVNNQVELRPSFNQKELRDWTKEHNITVTSYSTIKGGMDFDEPVIQEMKKKYGKSEAQIILNWAISQDIIVIPRSTKAERIKDNFEAGNWEMDPADVEKINAMPQKGRQTNNEWSDFDY
jgi:2,5-diketo-D-gluconate reductase B